MRVALDIGTPAPGRWTSWRDLAVVADREGLDGVLVGAVPGDEAGEVDALVLAASLAGPTRDLYVLARVAVGLHPVHLAERIAVADQALGGRLIVVLEAGPDQAAAEETLTVLELALGEIPFRHEGRRWQIPAGRHSADPGRFRMTPAPAALEAPVWVSGPGARALAGSTGRVWLAPADDREPDWPPGRAGAVRPALRALRWAPDGGLDGSAVSAELRSAAQRHGLSFAVLTSPRGSDAGPGGVEPAQVSRVAHGIRPRVQLSTLDPGLTAFWEQFALDGP